MTTHELKVDPAYMDALLDASKPFEVRRNDRGFQAGDWLRLREFFPAVTMGTTLAPARYGREMEVRVSYVYSGDPRFSGIEPGHVVLGLGEFRDGR